MPICQLTASHTLSICAASGMRRRLIGCKGEATGGPRASEPQPMEQKVSIAAVMLSTGSALPGARPTGPLASNLAFMPPFHPPSFPSQERVPLAEPAAVQPLPAEPKDPRLLRKAMAWTSGLMVAVGVASLCLGWVFNPGVYLDASGWQQLLAENLLPIFKLYFTESGEPPQMAAAHAAAAAAKQGGMYSHRDVFLALFGALSTLFTFCAKAWLHYLKIF